VAGFSTGISCRRRARDAVVRLAGCCSTRRHLISPSSFARVDWQTDYSDRAHILPAGLRGQAACGCHSENSIEAMPIGSAGGRRRRSGRLELVDHVHPLGHLAEHGVLAVQPGQASAVTMKNCEPLVSGPALAIASAPRTILWG
jgi:hypothetical protein